MVTILFILANLSKTNPDYIGILNNKKIAFKQENNIEELIELKNNHTINKNNYNNNDINNNIQNLVVKEEKIDPEKFSNARRRTLQLLKKEKCFIIGAAISAACNGTIWPIYGILLADAINALSNSNKTQVSSDGLKISMMFMALAFSAGLALWMQNFFFFGIGEKITRKLRIMIFNKFLNMHMGFFDIAENSPGSLLTKLSSDTSKIDGIATSVIGTLIQIIVTLSLGITLAFTYSWQLTLVNLGFMPLIIGNYVLQFKLEKGSENSDEKIDIEVGTLLSETVNNTKTIFSYNMEKSIVELYKNTLEGYNKGLFKTTALVGILFGLAQFVLFAMYAVLFYIGGNLYGNNKEVSFQFILRAIFVILFSSLGVGVAQAFVGDYEQSKKSIVSIFKTLDEKSLIDVEASEEKGIKKANFGGKIEFRNVKFAYPTRPENFIFKNLSFVIKPGQSVAFVGPSGSGKSTIISLIERFYDVVDGNILIDNIDIKEYDIKNLRKNIGLVLQEPSLFKKSIRENIRYGRLDANDEEIDQAAKDAYIDKLLHSSDENEDITVSGGEKQRIAIARAILKNPTILLLDEATSALDKHSEEYVKISLDKLMVNRTSIVVAHR